MTNAEFLALKGVLKVGDLVWVRFDSAESDPYLASVESMPDTADGPWTLHIYHDCIIHDKPVFDMRRV